MLADCEALLWNASNVWNAHNGLSCVCGIVSV